MYPFGEGAGGNEAASVKVSEADPEVGLATEREKVIANTIKQAQPTGLTMHDEEKFSSGWKV